MIGAVVKDNMVVNLIVIKDDSDDILAIEKALDCKLYDASIRGLIVGDVLTEAGWTRNAGGEQILLPLLEPKNYDSYSLVMERAIEAEAQLETVADATADEVLAILTGEDVVE